MNWALIGFIIVLCIPVVIIIVGHFHAVSEEKKKWKEIHDRMNAGLTREEYNKLIRILQDDEQV